MIIFFGIHLHHVPSLNDLYLISNDAAIGGYLFKENSVTRASCCFTMPVPERRIASIHVAFKANRASTARERHGVRHRH